MKKHQREYNKRPEVKVRKKNQQRKYQIEYHQRPEVKARKKKYYLKRKKLNLLRKKK